MVGLRRMLRFAGLIAIAAAVFLSVGFLDGLVGTGHFLLGLGLGICLGLAGFLAFITYSHQRAMKRLPLRQPAMQTEPLATFDWTVVALDGSIFPMERVRGETLVLNIWSTMCAPCVAELPSIERLHKAVRDDGIVVMCIATDSDTERVRNFVAEKGWQLPVYVLGQSEIPQVFDSDYIPATYVVNAEGRVVYQHTGAALWDHPQVVRFLRGLAVQDAVGRQPKADG